MTTHNDYQMNAYDFIVGDVIINSEDDIITVQEVSDDGLRVVGVDSEGKEHFEHVDDIELYDSTNN